MAAPLKLYIQLEYCIQNNEDADLQKLSRHRFIMHLVTDDNYNEKILYTTQKYNLTYITCITIYAEYSRVKYNDSRELLIMVIIINVLLLNH